MSLPNLLTIMRLLLVPVVAYLLLHRQFAAAGVVFAVAALTDALDGWLARRLNQITRLGQVLDPLADKALVNSAMMTSAVLGLLPMWFALLVLVRDVFVLASCFVTRVMGLTTEFLPGLLGKAAVASQMLCLAVVLLPRPEWLDGAEIVAVLVALAACLTVLSAVVYTVAWVMRPRRLA